MPDVADINRKQRQKSYDEGWRTAIDTASALLVRYAQQFGEESNPRIALTVAAEGISELREVSR